jgi:hypothetical protein
MSVTVAPGAPSPPLLFTLIAPEQSGQHTIWVEVFQLDFGHSGIDPLQIRQERAGAVQKLYEVWSEGRHHEIL